MLVLICRLDPSVKPQACLGFALVNLGGVPCIRRVERFELPILGLLLFGDGQQGATRAQACALIAISISTLKMMLKHIVRFGFCRLDSL